MSIVKAKCRVCAAVLSISLSAAACATRPTNVDGAGDSWRHATGRGVQDNSHAPPKTASSASAKPDFTGRWLLDADASDDPAEALRDLQTAMAGGRRASGGMGSYGGRRSGGSTSAPIRNGDRSLGATAALLQAPEILDISHEEPLMTVIGPDGSRRRIFTDFRGTSISLSGGPQQPVTVAGWENGVLVVETTPNTGPRLIQRYRLAANGRQLLLQSEVAVPQAREPLQVRYVYELTEP